MRLQCPEVILWDPPRRCSWRRRSGGAAEKRKGSRHLHTGEEQKWLLHGSRRAGTPSPHCQQQARTVHVCCKHEKLEPSPRAPRTSTTMRTRNRSRNAAGSTTMLRWSTTTPTIASWTTTTSLPASPLRGHMMSPCLVSTPREPLGEQDTPKPILCYLAWSRDPDCVGQPSCCACICCPWTSATVDAWPC
jgi:hypothetical protein